VEGASPLGETLSVGLHGWLWLLKPSRVFPQHNRSVVLKIPLFWMCRCGTFLSLSVSVRALQTRSHLPRAQLLWGWPNRCVMCLRLTTCGYCTPTSVCNYRSAFGKNYIPRMHYSKGNKKNEERERCTYAHSAAELVKTAFKLLTIPKRVSVHNINILCRF